MYSRILVPLDGSEQAEHAVALAGRLARASGGSVVLTQVLNAPAELLPYVVPGFEPSTLGADLQGAANYLTALSAVTELQDVPVEIEAHAGLAPSMILQLIRSKGADAVVLSHSAHASLKQWALGGVARKVAHHTDVPVLLLPEGGPDLAPKPADAPGAADTPGALRVLVPLDGSRTAEDALVPAATLVALLSGPARGLIHLLHVFDATDRAGNVPDSARTWAANYLKDISDRLRAALATTLPNPPEITSSAAPGTDVAATISTLAAQGNPVGGSGEPGRADCIALTTRGRSGFQPWSVGSVADRLMRSAALPLLITHPAQEGAQVGQAR